MVALWILGILLALILLVLFLRVGVRIAFGDELRVTAAAGPVRIQIVPSPPKKPKKTEKAQGEKESARKAEGSAPGEAEAGPDARRYPVGAAVPVAVPERGPAKDPAAAAH